MEGIKDHTTWTEKWGYLRQKYSILKPGNKKHEKIKPYLECKNTKSTQTEITILRVNSKFKYLICVC